MPEIEYTPNLALAKQPTGAREWGTVLNENFDKIDAEFGQVGIKNYSDTETYAAGEFVIAVIDDQVGIYKSLQSGNIGHLLTDESWWEAVPLGTCEIELNNPFSLLDYKWSEYELNNASWLLSDGQFNSGATYISVYNLLLEIYNGTVTKEGVSVKLSTEAYSNTDFVINTADTTFRLPINVKLASGNTVVGNGKVLGLTNGSSNFSLATRKAEISGYSYALMGGAVGIYGQSVGSTDITSWRNVSEGVGVTKSEKSSGIETSSSGLKLYFYVGETIQDANIIVASQVLTEISKKTDKVQASEASMPSTKYTDLTLGASGTTYTAPANGWFALSKKATAVGQYIQLYKPLYSSLYASTTNSSSLITYLPISKGTNIAVYYTAGGETNYFRFIYAEGEAN